MKIWVFILAVFPSLAFAECRVVDHGDRVEAICTDSGSTPKRQVDSNGNRSKDSSELETELSGLDYLQQKLGSVKDKLREINEEKNYLSKSTHYLDRGPNYHNKMNQLMEDIKYYMSEESRYNADIRASQGRIASIKRRLGNDIP